MPSFISKYLIKDQLQKNVSTYSMLLGQSNPMYKSQYKLSAINTQFIVYLVTGLNNVLYDHNNSNTKQSILCNFNDYAGKHGPSNRTDQSALNDIDPDLNYFITDIRSLNTPYFDDQTFKEKFKFNNTLSMYHLNIRSLPEHFIEFTAYIEHLNIDFKIIALSETWLKPHHIDYIIPNYNIENELRIKRRGGGVSLYIHNSLQYKVRKDLKIGNDQETINSVFVEIDKNTTNTNQNLIVGCIYRPPWVKIADFIRALTPKLEKLKSENKYTLLMGDYNVDISPCIESDLAIEEFKNIFSFHHFFPLINQPTRETKSSNTILDNIYCNIPCPFDTCDVGILRPYISDHNAIFCILNDITLNKRAYTCSKCNFSNKNISKFKN